MTLVFIVGYGLMFAMWTRIAVLHVRINKQIKNNRLNLTK